MLEQEEIFSPAAYKVSQGDTRFIRVLHKKNRKNSWIIETINQILKNRVYIGELENFKVEVVNYKTKQRKRTSTDKHIIVPDTHEAIISKDDFNQAQIMMKTKYYPRHIIHGNLFKSIIFCSGCGRRMQIAYHPLKDGRLSAYYK